MEFDFTPIIPIQTHITDNLTKIIIESSQETLADFCKWLTNDYEGEWQVLIGQLAGNLTQAVEIMKDSLDKKKVGG